jgi:hypothetical protein
MGNGVSEEEEEDENCEELAEGASAAVPPCHGPIARFGGQRGIKDGVEIDSTQSFYFAHSHSGCALTMVLSKEKIEFWLLCSSNRQRCSGGSP